MYSNILTLLIDINGLLLYKYDVNIIFYISHGYVYRLTSMCSSCEYYIEQNIKLIDEQNTKKILFNTGILRFNNTKNRIIILLSDMYK